ncbi:putative inactive receptor-like protein kinase At3g56050 [Primulina tabacum]|uniref:putative inactive receptor-like protein kinase At3g56050 n=1 Tax=Primulina tabacum TaxID=48773 RepID=UPI003F591FB7
MKEFWRSKNSLLAALAICCLCLQNLTICLSLNDEGVALLRFKENVMSDPFGALSNWIDEVGIDSPCSWFGVGCSEGYVVALNLEDLCLRGTLAPDLGNLVHLKSIILRNNSFYGVIPEKLAKLKELEILDLGCNNFSGEVPYQLGNNFSLAILLLDNNEFLSSTYAEIYELQKLSEVQVEEELLSGSTRSSNSILWDSLEKKEAPQRKLLQITPRARRRGWRFLPPPIPTIRNSSSPSPSPSPSPATLVPSPSPSLSPVTRVSPPSLPNQTESPGTSTGNSKRHHRLLILYPAIGGPVFFLLLVVCFFYCKSGKVAAVNPWATGLSGPLRRAFVTGVPKFKRSELEVACEDFSNVISSSSVRTLYKGTLSSGVEIAVASIATGSAKEWSNSLEAQFRKKIDTLSKVSHKNFVSLLGYCEEEEPFTRMMIFEYAPNGTLFEHIHIREAEHLDWEARLRIAMGVAYCLEHMHSLTPSLAHKNLTSSSIYLTEDYAAKLADFVFLDEKAAAETEPNISSNVYSFGVVLFEIITGKLPYAVGSSDSLQDWASDYLRGVQSLRDTIDPTLKTCREDQLQLIDGLIRSCVDPDSRQRPVMNEVCVRLREITGIEPEGAIPKSSPLWWAELEIL